MISISNLEKHYGLLHALKSINVSIAPGKITAVLGPNGAGKTTLIKSVLGLVKPDSGTITVDGKKVNGDSGYREIIGYMPQIARYPENLTLQEIVEMICDIRGYGNAKIDLDSDKRLDLDLWKHFGLDKEKDKPFRTLSGGNRQKVSAVLAFLFRPKVLFLDEPSTGLDPVSSSVLKDKILAEKERGTTIILTSHIMSEVQELSDQVVYLLDGQICFEKSVSNLITETGQSTLERAIARKIEGNGQRMSHDTAAAGAGSGIGSGSSESMKVLETGEAVSESLVNEKQKKTETISVQNAVFDFKKLFSNGEGRS